MAIVTLPSIEHRGADGTGCAYVGLESTVFHSAKPASVFAQKLQDKEIKQFIGLRDNEILLYASHEDVRRALREALKKCGIEPNGRDVCYACQGGNYPDSYPHSF